MSPFIPEEPIHARSLPAFSIGRVEKREEAKRRYRRMVLCDEYRINGVNAMCKRAIAPTALPVSLSLSLSLTHSLSFSLLPSIQPAHSPSNCMPPARPIARLKGRRIAEEGGETVRECQPTKKYRPSCRSKAAKSGKEIQNGLFITPRDRVLKALNF